MINKLSYRKIPKSKLEIPNHTELIWYGKGIAFLDTKYQNYHTEFLNTIPYRTMTTPTLKRAVLITLM